MNRKTLNFAAPLAVAAAALASLPSCRSAAPAAVAGSDRLDRAEAEYDRGRLGSVIDLLKGRVQDSVRGSKLLGRAYLLSGDYANARESFARAAALDLNDCDAWMGVAEASEHDRFFERAAAAYEKVLKIQPRNADAGRRLAFLLADLGRYPDALAALRNAAALLPDDEDIRHRIGMIELSRNRAEEAETAFSFVLQKSPLHAPALMGRGVARMKLGAAQSGNRRDELLQSAEADLRKCMETAADWSDPCYNLGWLREEMLHDAAGAESAYAEALRRNPRDTNATLRMAGLLAQRGDKGRALELYKKSLDLTVDPRILAAVNDRIVELAK